MGSPLCRTTQRNVFKNHVPKPKIHSEVEARGDQMKKMKLTKKEHAIERGLIRGDYQPVSDEEFERIAEAVSRRKKDAVLNIRVNSEDLEAIRQKAKKMGVPYQTLISELIHRFAA